jgi:hypothetical protein
MTEKSLARSAVLMTVLVILAIGTWEFTLRKKGIGITYDETASLWADKRKMVYEPSDKATVFIGSSRIKYDLDIPTWEAMTRKHAIQLALQGNSPLPVLEDLANDPKFKGRLVVDVMEMLYFSTAPPLNDEIKGFIKYYHDETPSQKASFQIDRVLESKFVFLDQGFLTINAGLDNLRMPNRPGVFPGLLFPLDFERNDFDRQSRMSDRFLVDTNLQSQVTHQWLAVGDMMKNMPPPPADPIPMIMQSSKDAVDKIRARGGDVIFVRPPSSGPMEQMELHLSPKEAGWAHLLQATGCKGIYYTDYPAMNHFTCPEWSHLKPSDAVLYTKALIAALPSEFTRSTN